MHHSIIIPHRNYNDRLALCVWSIKRSAAHCGITDYEILIADSHSSVPPPEENNVTVLHDPQPRDFQQGRFNKPRCQNIAIEASRGDILTFLDADALVPRLWMTGVQRLLSEPLLTRLCYRVRKAPPETTADLSDLDTRSDKLDALFARCDTLRPCHEAYGRPEHKKFCPGPIFGNSHFSMRRDVLDGLRYNEEYVGKGFEDLWFIRETWMRNPDAYRAEILTDPDHALLSIKHNDGGPDWCFNERSRHSYNGSWRGMKQLLPIVRRR